VKKLLGFAVGIVFLGSALAQIAGGYAKANVKDPQVMAAAKFAVDTQNTKLKRTGSHAHTLLEISKAQIQVVAGINFRVCINTKLGTSIRSAEAVVYQNLQQKMILSSWAWKKCGIR
jgi:Aspartic acid proteinase inhibitor